MLPITLHAMIAVKSSGPWLNIKMSSYQYRKSHCGDKTFAKTVLISAVGINVLVKWDLDIEPAPWLLIWYVCGWSYGGLSARLQYLQCISNGDTAFLLLSHRYQVTTHIAFIRWWKIYYWHDMATQICINFGSGNDGFWPFRHQTITWTNIDLLSSVI